MRVLFLILCLVALPIIIVPVLLIVAFIAMQKHLRDEGFYD